MDWWRGDFDEVDLVFGERELAAMNRRRSDLGRLMEGGSRVFSLYERILCKGSGEENEKFVKIRKR